MTAETTRDNTFNDAFDNAFEYVIGTLRDDERRRFEKQLPDDESLQGEVRFWEQQLVALNPANSEVTPHAKTWTFIEKRLKQLKNLSNQSVAGFKSSTWLWPWRAAVISTLLIGLAVLFWLRTPAGINADYIAVLTDITGGARLTAITERGGSVLWLQWEDVEIPADASLQLWAESDRDGQSRSLAVFEMTTPTTHRINETTLRIIRDSTHLILTAEELGGSAVDEPSDTVLAQGECVRLQALNNPS